MASGQSLCHRYPQVSLDAFGLMRNFIQGIIVVDIRRQRTLRLEHPRSKNVLYSFFEVVSGFQRAKSSIRPASLQRAFSFYRIADDSSLNKTRVLIWQSPLRPELKDTSVASGNLQV